MIHKMFESTTIPVLEQVMNFSQARHSVLAGNIANMDTPGYRVRDLSPQKFEARLKDALVERDRRGTTTTDAGAFSPGHTQYTAARPIAEVTESLQDLLYHDDSTGSMEKQVAEISKNQMQHNLAVSILSSQFRLLQAAISERA
jgi:flagellar basal-body rod protein FlgB